MDKRVPEFLRGKITPFFDDLFAEPFGFRDGIYDNYGRRLVADGPVVSIDDLSDCHITQVAYHQRVASLFP